MGTFEILFLVLYNHDFILKNMTSVLLNIVTFIFINTGITQLIQLVEIVSFLRITALAVSTLRYLNCTLSAMH